MQRLIAFLRPLWLALGLLTTLPMAGLIASPVGATDSGRSVLCYPLVGLLIGLALAVLASVLSGVDAALGAVLVVFVWVALTGALHLDGLADCVDAWFAGHGRADTAHTLAVMKDPAAGPMAVVALVLLLGFKSAALASLWPEAGAAVLVASMLGRVAAMLLMATTGYRRRDGLASALSANLSRGGAWCVALVAIALALLVIGEAIGVAIGAAMVLAGGVTGLGWRALWQRRIGGYTGDVVGGVIELVETAALVAAALAVTAWG